MSRLVRTPSAEAGNLNTDDPQRIKHGGTTMPRAMRLTLPLAAALFVLPACSADTGGGTSKYDQTWPHPYSQTTCADWNDDMTSAQQWAAAADMLTGARNKGDGGEGLPPDPLVDEFRAGITTACVVDTMTLADVGAGLYLTERETFRP